MNKHFLAMVSFGLAIGASAMPPAAADDVVAIMAPVAPPLTRDQIVEAFLGRSAGIKPVDLPESSVAREIFYRQATGRDAAQVRAVWARLIFTGRSKLPRELPDAAAVKKAVAADPNVIGYIDRSDLDATVKVVFSLERRSTP